MLENRMRRGRIRCEQEAFDRESTSEFAFLTNPTLGRKGYTDRVRQCICMNGWTWIFENSVCMYLSDGECKGASILSAAAELSPMTFEFRTSD